MIITRFPVRTVQSLKRYIMATKKENLSLVALTADDIPKVQTFLKKFFYRDEPLNICMKLWEKEETVKALEIYSTLPIKFNCSLMVVDENDKVVGVCLNKIRKMEEQEEDNAVFEDPVFSKLIGLMSKVDNECKIAEKFSDVDSYMQHDIISVDPSVRGQGIAKKMLDTSSDLAIKLGIKLLRMDCTSLYSAKAASRLGFTNIYSIKYADYKINGEPVFKPEAPHTEFSVYAKRIDGFSTSSKL